MIPTIFFLLILLSGCLGSPEYNRSSPGSPTRFESVIPSMTTIHVNNSISIPQPPSVTEPVNKSVTTSTDSIPCSEILVHPELYFHLKEGACPADLPPPRETYTLTDPFHPTIQDYETIPVYYPGIADRISLIRTAMSDSCVRSFLTSGGGIVMISSQPHSNDKTEGMAGPPAHYAFRRINCTDMLVQFDIDTTAGNVTRITVFLNSYIPSKRPFDDNRTIVIRK